MDDDDEHVQKRKDDIDAGLVGPATRVPPVVSHWNLAEYLPSYVEECFVSIIGQFLLRPVLKGAMKGGAPAPAASAPVAPVSKSRLGKSFLADPVDDVRAHFFLAPPPLTCSLICCCVYALLRRTRLSPRM